MKIYRAAIVLSILASVPAVRAQDSPDIFKAPSTKVNLYVSATNGNDNWTGTIPNPNSTRTDGPLQTLHAARLAVSRVQQAYSTLPVRLKQVRVQFEAGTYFLPATEYFTESDSGMNGTQVIYENYKSDQPLISGGVALTGWTKVSENRLTGVVTWRASTPHTYFENLYYNGVRLLRPRLATNFSGPIAETNGYLGTYFRVAGQVTVPAAGAGRTCPEPDPKDPSMNICVDRFYYDPNDPISSTWQNLTAPNIFARPAKTLHGFRERTVTMLTWRVSQERSCAIGARLTIIRIFLPPSVTRDTTGFRRMIRIRDLWALIRVIR